MSALTKYLADNTDPNSLATKLRRRRFAFFVELLNTVPRPLAILDVGGTPFFWQQMGFLDQADVSITVLNVDPAELQGEMPVTGRTQFVKVLGDARSMPQFQDKQFDAVFSNSVLEHFAQAADQQRMVNEVQRVGKRFFLQTPSFFFPIEPHFHVPGFQFMPIKLRTWLLCHFDLGWTKRVPDRETARQIVSSVRLLSAKDLRRLCPGAQLYRERFLGITKSFVIYGGW